MKHLLKLTALLLAFQFFSVSVFSQGSLNPPGPPASTMKTLQQVEPRIDLQNAPLAAVDTSSGTYHFVINQPGSYYLSANLGVTKTSGILIGVEGVTLDLNGFEISRASGSGGDGIQIPLNGHRSTILNGSIKGFAVGINSVDGINGARGCKFRELSVSGCTTIAIFAGPSALLESCGVQDNTGTHGILCGYGSTLTKCTASANTVTYGISAGVGSTLVNCSASKNTCSFGIFADAGSSLNDCHAFLNTGTGAISSGISASSNCIITACSAVSNISSNATFTSTTGIGFDVGTGSTVQGCTVSNNRGDGIRLNNSAVARDNNCVFNGSSGDGAGIHATSSGNRIEANSVSTNDRGIDVDGLGNVILRNTARGNTVNYDIAANNVFGTIVDRTAPGSPAVSGNSATSSTATTDPGANISY